MKAVLPKEMDGFLDYLFLPASFVLLEYVLVLFVHS